MLTSSAVRAGDCAAREGATNADNVDRTAVIAAAAATGAGIAAAGAGVFAGAQTTAPFTADKDNSVVYASAGADDGLGAPTDLEITNPTVALSNEDQIRELPPFVQLSRPNFQWGDKKGEEFVRVVEEAYHEVSGWRRNVFLVPSGSAGKEFVDELTRLFNAYAQASALESVAFKLVMVGCTLLLQKPHMKSKTRDHVNALERRRGHCWFVARSPYNPKSSTNAAPGDRKSGREVS